MPARSFRRNGLPTVLSGSDRTYPGRNPCHASAGWFWLALSQMGIHKELAKELDENAEKVFPWMNEQLAADRIGTILRKENSSQSGGMAQGSFRVADPLPQSTRMQALEFIQLPVLLGNRVSQLSRIRAPVCLPAPKPACPLRGGQAGQPSGQTSPVQDSRSLGRPGKFRPVVSDGVIFTWWGYGADPDQLVAMDLKSREILWSLNAAGPKNSGRKIPLGNPVLSGGQLFAASAWSNRSGSSVYFPAQLHRCREWRDCMDFRSRGSFADVEERFFVRGSLRRLHHG